MVIEKIELNHYRNYDHLQLFPQEGINLFFGKNGSGKTNLLEAIHYCALGKSHRISQDAHAVEIGEKTGFCSVSVRGKWTKNEISVQLLPEESSAKSVFIDHKKVKKLSEMMGVLRCVIFSPEDLDLIKEGPSCRRRFLDMMISQINRSYFVALQQYKTAMEQRNAILRNCRINECSPDSMIIDFEETMAKHAGIIHRERKKAIDIISDEGMKTYCKISGRKDEIFNVQYHSFLKKDETIDQYMQNLVRNREEDIRQGITTIGPHRDDIQLTLNKKNMKLFASQGQMRTAALSLKLCQLHILKEAGGENPVLLLDDVMSELDLQRRMNLLKEIGNTQTFITFSDETDLEELNEYRTYFVFSEKGKGNITEKNKGPEKISTELKEPDFS